MQDVLKYAKIIKNYSKNSYLKLMRQPLGELKHPYIVPGIGYGDQLWDWDSWLTSVAISQIILDNDGVGNEKFLECEKGCVLNFLDSIDENGKMSGLKSGIIINYNPETQTIEWKTSETSETVYKFYFNSYCNIFRKI